MSNAVLVALILTIGGLLGFALSKLPKREIKIGKWVVSIWFVIFTGAVILGGVFMWYYCQTKVNQLKADEQIIYEQFENLKELYKEHYDDWDVQQRLTAEKYLLQYDLLYRQIHYYKIRLDNKALTCLNIDWDMVKKIQDYTQSISRDFKQLTLKY